MKIWFYNVTASFIQGGLETYCWEAGRALARRRGRAAQTVIRSGGAEFYVCDRYFAGSVDHWLSTSRDNAALVEARYGREVQVVHDGVDVDHFKPTPRATRLRQSLGLPGNARVTASVGRLVGWTRLCVILELPPGEVETWRNSIGQLLQQPDRLRAMGAAGRERAVAEFTWAANAAKLELLLLEVCRPCAAS